jgi:hypothetical protein
LHEARHLPQATFGFATYKSLYPSVAS